MPEGVAPIVIGFAIVVFLILISSIRIVSEYKRLVILQLGRYRGTRGPGLTIVIPLLEQAISVDLREDVFDIPPQTVITKDNAAISIDFLVYYKIIAPDLSVLKIENVQKASINIAATTVRAVIGDIELDDVLSRREEINDVLRVKLDEATDRWGMKITSVEIREIEPPRSILDAMTQQMTAERQRRAEVTRAAGEREAAVTIAEGQKQAAILKAQGEREAAILKAQGEREAQLLSAQGYAAALKAIYQEARNLDERTMALQYMEMLQEIGKSPSTKFVLPMELVSFVQQFATSAGLGAGAVIQQQHSNGSNATNGNSERTQNPQITTS